MAECPSIGTCSFINDAIGDLDYLVSIYKKRFCKGNNLKCARFKVASSLGKEFVPKDLSPNELYKALDIIKAHNK